MMLSHRSRRTRNRTCRLQPVMALLEERVLLNAAMPHGVHESHVSAEVHVEQHQNQKSKQKGGGPTITALGKLAAGGYVFTNFDGPTPGTNPGAGTNQNGISNSGSSVGFTIDNNGNFHNFTVNPLKSKSAKVLNIKRSTTAMAFGTNSSGTVVGTDGNGNAFILSSKGKLTTFIPTGGSSATAFGINDKGMVVGQDVVGGSDAGVHPGQSQDLHHDQCALGSHRRERPEHQQQGAGGRLLCRHRRSGPRLHGK